MPYTFFTMHFIRFLNGDIVLPTQINCYENLILIKLFIFSVGKLDLDMLDKRLLLRRQQLILGRNTKEFNCCNDGISFKIQN